MNCLYCGKAMPKCGDMRKDGRLYCSRECWQKHYRTKQKEINKRICVICGRQLTGRDRKVCKGECRIEYARQRKAEHKSVYLSKFENFPEKKRIRKPKLTLEQINAVARMRGMSYGQFTARYIIAPTTDIIITTHKKWAVFNFGDNKIIATTGAKTVVGSRKEIQKFIAKVTGMNLEDVVT